MSFSETWMSILFVYPIKIKMLKARWFWKTKLNVVLQIFSVFLHCSQSAVSPFTVRISHEQIRFIRDGALWITIFPRMKFSNNTLVSPMINKSKDINHNRKKIDGKPWQLVKEAERQNSWNCWLPRKQTGWNYWGIPWTPKLSDARTKGLGTTIRRQEPHGNWAPAGHRIFLLSGFHVQ